MKRQKLSSEETVTRVIGFFAILFLIFIFAIGVPNSIKQNGLCEDNGYNNSVYFDGELQEGYLYCEKTVKVCNEGVCYNNKTRKVVKVR